MICNKIANKISNNSPQSNSDTLSQKEVKSIEITKEQISPEQIQKVISKLKLI